MGPILLKPNYISPVWSGPRVNEARGLSGDTLYGESFDVSVHDGLSTMSTVARLTACRSIA